MHTDEAVNAYLLGQTLAGQPFRYDATDRHGPALTAIALPLVRAQGARTFADLTEFEVRLVPVLIGTVTLLLFGAAVEIFGFVPCLVASLLTAIAPLPLYYDRYFIHEPLLTAATLLLAVAAYRLWHRPRLAWAALAGGSLAIMLATKETAVLNLAALAIAAFCARLWTTGRRVTARIVSLRMLAVGVAAFLLVGLAFYSWFGQQWQGISQLLRVVPSVLQRAGGEGHRKPFWYYGQLLATGRSGVALTYLVLAGGAITLIRRKNPWSFGLACYGLFVAAIYSAIPYKTPWLGLNLWMPFVLLVGVAIQAPFRLARSGAHRRLLTSILLVASASTLGFVATDAWRRVYLHPADEDNPYAYAHTGEDLLDLPAAIDRLARERDIASPRIAVIAADPWPLPWYLRRYRQTGFWQPGQDPGPADFYITSTEAADQYRTKLHDLRPEFFGVRPGVLILVWSREHP